MRGTVTVQAREVVAERALGMPAQWQLAAVESGGSNAVASSTLLFCCHVKPPKKIVTSGRPRGLTRPFIEMFARQRELRSRASSSHEIAAGRIRRIPKALFAIPAEMFARDPDSGLLAVEGVQGVEM